MSRIIQDESNHTMSLANPGMQNEDSGDASEQAISCNGCRKRKLKCSREAPACQNCRKIGGDCIYESKRGKPGLRAGAVENLHRRLDNLEKVVEQLQETAEESNEADQDVRAGDTSRTFDSEKVGYEILSFLAKEFQRFNNSNRREQFGRDQTRSDDDTPNQKRRRLNDNVSPPLTPITFDHVPGLPQPENLEDLFEVYFTHIHPWIPMIHQGRLRRRLLDSLERPKLEVVLQAIVLIGSRFVSADEIATGDNPKQTSIKEEQQRNWIVSNAMSSMCVESLQALIIVAFNDIGSGEAEKAWSLIGSLTRIVEYMQLTIENEDQSDRYSVSQPFVSLDRSQSWTEEEERRRVFWNIFNLDRFCSVSMGWNTSLTSDDVHRRLPCDGVYWRKHNTVSTPYFGIWDRSAGRIGNPITFLPSHHFSPSQPSAIDEDVNSPQDPMTQAAASPEGFSASTIDVMMSTVGAFAYSIEATESLSRVTSYFLQQKVNFKDPRDVGSWLTRFKELDLRLVHWKMLLPKKWKVHMDSSRAPGKMDPNLTLAHVTHNTSMILLHQPIAFPLAQWDFKNRLPSGCSAETCRAAAVEIAIITENYLRVTSHDMPLSAQYSFCLYVAGRVLIAHWRYYSDQHPPEELWSIVQSLGGISKRWTRHIPNASLTTAGQRCDLAAKYANKLQEIHDNCLQSNTYQINVLGYTRDVDLRLEKSAASPPARRLAPSLEASNMGFLQAHNGDIILNQHAVPEGLVNGYAQANIELVDTGQAELGGGIAFSPAGSNTLPSVGDLGAISQMLLNQQFLGMDRVISFDDGMFNADLEGGGW